MTDSPISHSPWVNRAEKDAAAFAQFIALVRSVCGALAQATARNAERRATRHAPEELLMAQACREEARRAVDRLLQLR